MRIRLNPLWLLVSVLAVSLQISRAQVEVPPVVSFDLGGDAAPDTSLWDLTGTYTVALDVEQPNGLVTSMSLGFNLLEDARGNLSGSTNDFQELDLGDNSFFAVSYSIKGKITGSGGTGRVHFTIHFTGNGTLAGQQVDNMSGSLTVDAEAQPGTGQLMGTKISKFSVNFGRFGKLKGLADFATALPSGVDGTWNLSMQMAALNKVTGSAIITTPTEQFGFNLSGAFKSPFFFIKAKGVAGLPNGAVSGAGSSASIQLPTTFDSIQLKGKLLGQSLFFIFPEN
jgi:hypothetical protein